MMPKLVRFRWSASLALLTALAPLAAQDATAPEPASAPAETTSAAVADPLAAPDASAPVPAYVPPTVPDVGGSPVALLARLVVSLGLVVGMILVTGWLARNRSGLPAPGAPSRLEVVETLNLGTQRALFLVRVGGQAVLIGSGGGQLSSLGQFPLEEFVTETTTAAEPLPAADSFLARLQAAAVATTADRLATGGSR